MPECADLRAILLTAIAALISPIAVAHSEESCDTLIANADREYKVIASCTADSDCGQVLRGTSCGCTQDRIARRDADSTKFYEAWHALEALESCRLLSTCVCPEADGFKCSAGLCGWNYTQTMRNVLPKSPRNNPIP